MNRVEAKALREERAQIIADQRKLLDAAAEAKRDLTGEEDAQYKAMEARTDKLAAEIARVEKLEAEERALAASQGTVTRTDVRPGDTGEDDTKAKAAEKAKVSRAITNYLRFGAAEMPAEERAILARLRQSDTELRAQTITTSGGGYLIPDDTALAAAIDQARLAYGNVAGVATTISTSTGADLDWPTVNDTSNEGAILAINTQDTEQAITFGQLTLNAFVYTSKIVLVPFQLLQDSAVNIDALVGRLLGERIARIENRHFTVGTGSGQPNGIVTASAAGVTAATSTAVTADELIDLAHTVDPAYRTAGAYMFHDTTLREIKQLKDSQNRYLFLPGLAVREPDTINGYPYVVNQHMATMQASAKSIIFGDFAKYMIRRVQGTTLLRLTERYADYLQVGFLAYSRADGELSDAGTNPVKYLIHPSP